MERINSQDAGLDRGNNNVTALGKARSVVSFSAHDLHRAMAPLRQVEAYWHALRPAEGIPLRSDIDPRGIESALEYAFIAEKLTPQMAKFRVAGCHVNDVMGMHMAGMPLSSLIETEDRRRFAEALEEVFLRPGIVTIRLESAAAFGQPGLVGELVLMPLRSDLGDVSRILGCFVTCGSIGRAPRRFSVSSVSVRGLDEPLRLTDPLPLAPVAPQPKVPGMAERPVPFRPAPIRKAAQLTLVVDNERR